MKKFLSSDILTIFCRVIFGGIFIYASLDKIANPYEFARIVNAYHLLPVSLVNIFALILPMSELLAGVFLIVGLFYRGSRDYLLLLMVVFIIAIGVNFVRGVDLNCGCFSVSTEAKSSAISLLVRDALYLIPGLILLVSRSRRWMLDNLLKVHR